MLNLRQSYTGLIIVDHKFETNLFEIELSCWTVERHHSNSSSLLKFLLLYLKYSVHIKNLHSNEGIFCMESI